MEDILTEQSKETPVAAGISPEAPIKKRRGRPPKKATAAGIVAPSPVQVTDRVVAKKVPKVLPKETPLSASAPLSQMLYIFAVGRRKRAVARVFLYREGKGEVEVNEKPVDRYFPSALLKDITLQALVHSPFRNSVRVVAKVRGGGIQGQADAVCLGIARALLKLDATLRPTFRARGFLTRDPREKERKKPGLKKARRAPQWQKR